MSFEEVATTAKMKILKIERDKTIIARGIYMPEAVCAFEDNATSVISYPDTGVFVLFKGSFATTKNEKTEKYINNFSTTREILFQSRNAAAKFVLGEKGRTNDWT